MMGGMQEVQIHKIIGQNYLEGILYEIVTMKITIILQKFTSILEEHAVSTFRVHPEDGSIIFL
jgi:hypothetical protein